MKRPVRFYGVRNQFQLLPPAQHILTRARRAGVDTTSRPAVEYWRRTGIVNNTGEIE